MSVYKVVKFTNKNGEHLWKLVAGNGRILAHSESYSSRTKRDATVKRLASALGLVVVEAKK